MPRTRLPADPGAPTLTRRLLLAVIVVGIVLVVVAAVMLVGSHDPERLYPARRGYRRGGYSVLFPQLFAAGLYALVGVLALVTFFRSAAPAVAAAYAFVNAAALPFVAFAALGPWLAGEGRYSVLSPGAAAVCCGWLALAAAVALTYWIRHRRVTAGQPRGRSALLAIAELLNRPVER